MYAFERLVFNMEKRYVIVAHQATVGYEKGKKVVSDIQIELESGKIMALVGPNGCGKSTILKTFTKQLELQSGKVLVLGEDFCSLTEKEIATRVSMVMTDRIHPELMTCKEVVETGRYPYTGFLGVLGDKDHQFVWESMKQTNCLDLADKPFGQISDGQRQRVMLARAMCQEPDLLILDEPTTYLDLKYQLELLEIIKHLAKEQSIAILMSLHELEYVKKVADVCICIKDGCVDCIGAPKDILTANYICRLFDLEEELYQQYSERNDLSCEEASHMMHCYKGTKKLRYGYTTGSCVAAAVYAAGKLLLGEDALSSVVLKTPKGITVHIPVEQLMKVSDKEAICSNRKDAGDDKDATDGMLLETRLCLTDEGVHITGGKGIGKITLPGLQQPVGEYAINNGPREMIQESLRMLVSEYGYTGGFLVEISAPKGEEIAKKTFNPNLGIEGGISILGSSGIVEPMSEQALLQTIHAELAVKTSGGNHTVLLTPGNYGRDFANAEWGIDLDRGIKCSNFIGETIDMGYEFQVDKILLIGHIGKLVKLGSGIMNTHSKTADGRMETLAICGMEAGVEPELIKRILECISTDQALTILRDAGVLSQVMVTLIKRVMYYLNRRAYEGLQIEVIIFSNEFGVLGESDGAKQLLQDMKGAVKKTVLANKTNIPSP